MSEQSIQEARPDLDWKPNPGNMDRWGISDKIPASVIEHAQRCAERVAGKKWDDLAPADKERLCVCLRSATVELS